jgi:hypothetical protein
MHTYSEKQQTDRHRYSSDSGTWPDVGNPTFVKIQYIQKKNRIMKHAINQWLSLNDVGMWVSSTSAPEKKVGFNQNQESAGECFRRKTPDDCEQLKSHCKFKGRSCLPNESSQVFWIDGKSKINARPSGEVYTLINHIPLKVFPNPDVHRNICVFEHSKTGDVVVIMPVGMPIRIPTIELELISSLIIHILYTGANVVLGGHSMGAIHSQMVAVEICKLVDPDDRDELLANMYVFGSGCPKWASADDRELFELVFQGRFMFFGRIMPCGIDSFLYKVLDDVPMEEGVTSFPTVILNRDQRYDIGMVIQDRLAVRRLKTYIKKKEGGYRLYNRRRPITSPEWPDKELELTVVLHNWSTQYRPQIRRFVDLRLDVSK